ncbi:MAG: transglycosylase SLT domain-containing protein [Xanthomonadaceae bacterium]|jgi:soluble lytic murein transglycosylase|nr:transglycosylase SLT domain-containing protein [Xanthomonadaceae bacterium]
MSRSILSLFCFAVVSLCSPLCAQNPDAQRSRMRTAIEAAQRGQFDRTQVAALGSHPLYPWLEYANLARNIDTLPDSQIRDFLRRYDGQPVADSLRTAWMQSLARRKEWVGFLGAWKPTDNIALRCNWLNAQNVAGNAGPKWNEEAQTIWRGSGKSLPDACDPVFEALAARGGLPPELRWERFAAAAELGETGVMRHIARGFTGADAAQATDYAAFVAAPDTRALNWPRNARSRRMASYGLAQLARRDSGAAEMQLPRYASALGMNEAERGRVLYQIALWTVASYGPDSARRLDSVPESAYDERLHEWRVREALARGDWPSALAAIRKMPVAQREDSRWRYFEARMLEKTGDNAAARTLYRQAATAATFHGFLAADRLNQPYRLCPWQPGDSVQARARIARDPGIVRAMELFKIDKVAWALREWNGALARLDDTQRRLAVEVANQNGWFDRAVFSLGKAVNEQRLYELRFPIQHTDTIRRESARNGLDPVWVAAEIRAESIFNPNARSSANAMGLMQVLPATGARVARDIGYSGASSLYDPDTNITLGTAYLRQQLDNYGAPYFAIAAYNAGPTPVRRWLDQRPNYDPDIWIETIGYKETREYVARVLAFSVIYDWRMNGDALPLSERMQGRTQASRKSFVCPAGS